MVHISKEKTGKARAQLELKLASVVSGNKKGLFRYDSNMRKSKENIGPILVEDGHLTNKGEVKVEVFNAFFSSLFSAIWCPC